MPEAVIVATARTPIGRAVKGSLKEPIWQTEAFSSWFLHVLLTSLRDGKEPSAAVPGGFSDGLRRGWIAALQNDPLFARWFAHAYAGVDPD